MFCARKRINILLGAGASIGIAPTTNDLTQSLLAWTRYMPTDARLGTDAALNQTHYTGAGQTRYYQAIYDWISPFYKNPSAFLHFERLIYASLQLDPFTTERMREQSSNYSKSLIRPFFSTRKRMHGFDNKLIHTGITEEACSFILNSVSAAVLAKVTQVPALPLVSFFKALGRKAQLQLFSLNYDSVPFFSGLEFETGFSHPGSGCRYFDLASLQDSEKKHLWVQLHGSCLFGYPPPNQSHGRHFVVRFDDENNALTSRRNTATTGTFNQDGNSNPHRLMITGMRKADALLDEPFAAYFHKFRHEAMKSPVYVVIGYGGGDRHVNETLQSAFEYWRLKRKRVKIVWIGFASDPCFVDGVAHWDAGSKIIEQCGSLIGSTFGSWLSNYLGHPRSLWAIERNKVQKVSLEQADVFFSFRGTDATFRDHMDEVLAFIHS